MITILTTDGATRGIPTYLALTFLDDSYPLEKQMRNTFCPLKIWQSQKSLF